MNLLKGLWIQLQIKGIHIHPFYCSYELNQRKGRKRNVPV